jgi:hypothetical protein
MAKTCGSCRSGFTTLRFQYLVNSIIFCSAEDNELVLVKKFHRAYMRKYYGLPNRRTESASQQGAAVAPLSPAVSASGAAPGPALPAAAAAPGPALPAAGAAHGLALPAATSGKQVPGYPVFHDLKLSFCGNEAEGPVVRSS